MRHDKKLALNIILFLTLNLFFSNSLIAQNNFFPSYGNNGNNIIATWLRKQNGVGATYGARKLGAGAWSTPVLLSDGTKTTTSNPLISVNSSNNAFVIWEGMDITTGNGFLLGATYTSVSDTWSSQITITTNTQDATGGKYAMNMDNLGNIKAIWTANTAGGSEIFYGTSTFNAPSVWTITQVSN